MDFLRMIEDYGFVDLGFYDPRYTWSNGRGQGSIVWKRLDRRLVNDNWLISYPTTSITNISSVESDHNPLLLEINVRQDTSKRYFMFLNYWVENENFLPLVQELKDLSNTLSKWSRQQYGDIFLKSKEYEHKLKQAVMSWAQTNDGNDR
uniref:Uncharacterized protein n=1 Tax=Nicotiana tabacum TaxID=4097 RepID=A0A1S4CSE6_TOBAC|nr:PREDICTED: uncharacterized protein LOC107822026 [Nicotiana tabacum]